MGEYDASGNVIAEHVYLKNIPVAVVKGANTYFVHTDYLNTPRAISNAAGTLVWKWDNTNAYGYNPANETVSGTAFEYNPRFAGQYFDKETGLHYNYHRMYNPELARYMQPDPIGVNGGMNIYSYVENNPLNAVDPMGLIDFDKNGKIIGELSNKWEKINVGTEKNPITLDVLKFTFKTDKGRDAIGYKYLDTGRYPVRGVIFNNYETNCHGLTFTRGQLLVFEDAVEIILEDEYKKINSDEKKNGNIGIYRKDNVIDHSVTVKWPGFVYEKDGISPIIPFSIGASPIRANQELEYYRKIPK